MIDKAISLNNRSEMKMSCKKTNFSVGYPLRFYIREFYPKTITPVDSAGGPWSSAGDWLAGQFI